MKAFETECIVKGTLSFILFVSSIAGVAPLQFESVHNGWRVKTSKIANLYGKILVAILCIFVIFSVGYSMMLVPLPFYLRTTSDRVVVVLTLVLALSVGLVGTFTAKERTCHMLNYLVQIENINWQLYLLYKQDKPKEWKMFACVIFLLMLGNLTVLTECGKFINDLIFDNSSELQSLNIFYYMMIEYIQIISFQFFLICSSVLNSFQLLNKCLKCVLKDVGEDYNNSKITKVASETVKRLALLYSSLCDVVRYVNDSNALLLLQLHVVYLLYLIITPYNFFTKLVKAQTLELYGVLLEFLWFLFHAANLVMVVEPCHQTAMKIGATKTLISKIMCHVPASEHAFNVELDFFYHHVMMHDVTYSPFKIFTLDRSLILTVAGSITTYLVIVLSF